MIGKIILTALVTCLAGAVMANIQIFPGVQNLLVGQGKKQTLYCFGIDQSVKSSALVWTNPIGINDTISSWNDTHKILTISNFTKEHAGNYVCSNISGETNKTIRLSAVKEHKMEGEYVFGNKSATLTCTVELPPGVQGTFNEWLKNNTALSQLKDHDRFTGYDNRTLVITDATRNDAGLYIARYNVTGEFGSYYDCEVVYKAAPLILDMEKSKNVVEDDGLDLTCLVKGYPLLNVTWLKDDKPVGGDHIQLTKHNGVENAVLSIKSVEFSDGGKYTCEAIGADGQKSSKSIIIRIKDKLEWLWPVIGIICEAVVLGIIIFLCNKFNKGYHEE